MTTANEIYVLAPNGTIFEVPTFGNDVYLPGIARGSRASFSTLYTATFTTEDTRDSTNPDLAYDSDNNEIASLSSPPYNPTLGSETETDDEFSAAVRAPRHAFRPVHPAPLSPTQERPDTPTPFAQ